MIFLNFLSCILHHEEENKGYFMGKHVHIIYFGDFILTRDMIRL